MQSVRRGHLGICHLFCSIGSSERPQTKYTNMNCFGLKRTPRVGGGRDSDNKKAASHQQFSQTRIKHWCFIFNFRMQKNDLSLATSPVTCPGNHLAISVHLVLLLILHFFFKSGTFSLDMTGLRTNLIHFHLKKL